MAKKPQSMFNEIPVLKNIQILWRLPKPPKLSPHIFGYPPILSYFPSSGKPKDFQLLWVKRVVQKCWVMTQHLLLSFSRLSYWVSLKDTSDGVAVALGSCNSPWMQGKLQVLGFFRSESAPWQDQALRWQEKNTHTQLDVLHVLAFL